MSSSHDTDCEDLCRYAAEILKSRLTRLFAHAEGARKGDNPRDIHQMRVWSRRARAAHDLFDACFPGKEYKTLGQELKAVTDALGTARDLDVIIETLQKRRQALAPAERSGMSLYIDRLTAQRAARQRDVERAVRRLERRRVRDRYAALLARQGVSLQADANGHDEKPTHGKPESPDCAPEGQTQDG